MTVKSTILEVLGGRKTDLLLMEKVRRALQANERVKYLFTLLQLAGAQARSPVPAPDDLSAERRRAGIEDAELDRVIPQAVLEREAALQIPAAERIVRMALEETARMCDPLVVANRTEARSLLGRLDSVVAACRAHLEPGKSPEESAEAGKFPGSLEPSTNGTLALPLGLVGRLASADRSKEDSLHLVVMDAHKALNSLIAELSGRREKIGDTDALGLTPEDRRLVEAFTEGVQSTRHLKGSHPGLGTTAMRVGSRLMIQNDIGETDAHVVLVEIEGDTLELTYTDVHDKRVSFFTELLADLPIKWKTTESRTSPELEEGAFFLLRGKLKMADPISASNALRVIGASLVFLIDWNKARKRIRTFLRGEDVPAVLLWAARERIGFMAFLSYGHEDLIYEALEALPRGTVRLGEPLSSILGREGAMEFLKEALRLSRDCLDRQEPRVLLLDRLRCHLLSRAKRRGDSAEEMLVEMATLAVETALAFRDSLRAVTRTMPGLIGRNFERIQRWEERADERLNRIRKFHLREPQPLLPVGRLVDDAMDAFEDAANLTLAIEEHFKERTPHPELVAILEEGAEIALKSTQLYYKILHRYGQLLRGGVGEPLFDVINELKQAELQGDKLKRHFLWKYLSMAEDSKLLFAFRELQERIEAALNALSRAGFLIHDLAYTAMERRHA